MANKIHVSVKELREYATRIYRFQSDMECDCTKLRMAFYELSDRVDHEIKDAFWAYIDSIENTLKDSKKELDTLQEQVRKYAVMVEKLEWAVQEELRTTQTECAKNRFTARKDAP